MKREEWEVELEKRKILQESFITEMRKEHFINEITNGLGDKIKQEPNKIQKKPGFLSRLKKIFIHD